MFFRGRAVVAALLLLACWATARGETAAPSELRVFGPGGPHHALREAAELYRERHGVAVGVYRANPTELGRRVREDGDIYYTGAEYMLDEFVREHPDALDPQTVEKLYPRRVGVIVRKGNPLGIHGAEALLRPDVDLLAAHLEGMEAFYSPPGGAVVKLPKLVFTGHEGLKAWRADPALDAWITYRSWHDSLKEEADFVELPGDEALRHTMVALTRRTARRDEARKFLDFLRTPEVRDIFLQHGWEGLD